MSWALQAPPHLDLRGRRGARRRVAGDRLPAVRLAGGPPRPICDTFVENPELLAIRAAIESGTPVEALDAVLGHSVAFWASEEEVLLQLYGVAAVDPAAAAFVQRQRADRRSELERLLRRFGEVDARIGLADLLVLTSFETYVELRRHAGLEEVEVVETLRSAARAMPLTPTRA
jgi:hypothetical protein